MQAQLSGTEDRSFISAHSFNHFATGKIFPCLVFISSLSHFINVPESVKSLVLT